MFSFYKTATSGWPEISTANLVPCPICGFLGHRIEGCSRVKAIEYHPDGTIRRIELHPPHGERPVTFPDGDREVDTP